jgi:phosphoribosylaminoimidazole-succinocarboxamide synthase
MSGSYRERLDKGMDPDSLDKEFLRLWITSQCDPYNDPIPEIPMETLLQFSEKYIKLYELVTGNLFEKTALSVSVRDRIKSNLGQELPEYFS